MGGAKASRTSRAKKPRLPLQRHVLGELVEPEGLGGEGPGPRLQPGQGKEGLDHPAQPLGLDPGGGQVAGALVLVHAGALGLQGLEVAGQHRERGPEVVGDPGQELAAVALGGPLGLDQLAHPAGELGKPRPEEVDLVGDPPGGLGQGAGLGVEAGHRRRQAPGAAGEEEGEDGGEQEGEEEQAGPRDQGQPEHRALPHGGGHRVEPLVGEEGIKPAPAGEPGGREDLAAPRPLGVGAEQGTGTFPSTKATRGAVGTTFCRIAAMGTEAPTTLPAGSRR